jgi:hypothetical protein
MRRFSIASSLVLLAAGMEIGWTDSAAADTVTAVELEAALAPRGNTVEAVLLALKHSQESTVTDLEHHWAAAERAPNRLHIALAPARQMRLNVGKAPQAVSLTEVLLELPQAPEGRQWPYSILVRTSDGRLFSMARMTVCQMRAILSAAGFDPTRDAPLYLDYCPEGIRPATP